MNLFQTQLTNQPARKEIVNDGVSREHCDFIIDYFLTSGKMCVIGSGRLNKKSGASREELEDEGDYRRDRWEKTIRLVGTTKQGGQGVT